MKTLGRRRGSTIGIVLLGYSLIAACTPQSGPTTSNNRGSHAEATYKTAPNEVVSQGDKALAEKEYLRALNRYEEASKEVNEKIRRLLNPTAAEIARHSDRQGLLQLLG